MRCSMLIPVGDVSPGEFQTIDAIREMAIALEQAGEIISRLSAD